MKELSLEEYKPMLVEMLLFFHDFCEKHGIKYYLTGGTLLGAVRHKGFIPWDDDIDLNVPRFDYEKLLDSFRDPTGRYRIISIRDKGYYLPSAKIIDTTTIMRENYDISFEIGLFIDLFPMDNLSNDIVEAKHMFKSIKKYRDGVTLKNLIIDNHRTLSKNIVIKIGKVVLIPFKRDYLLKKIDKKSRKYEKNEMTQFVGTVATGIYGEKEILKSEWFAQRVLLQFENKMFYAPGGYKEFLSQLYGDYMALPPKEKQISHHDSKVWLK